MQFCQCRVYNTPLRSFTQQDTERSSQSQLIQQLPMLPHWHQCVGANCTASSNCRQADTRKAAVSTAVQASNRRGGTCRQTAAQATAVLMITA
jgi:hypothetical protein